VSWIRKLECHPRLKGLLTFVSLVHHISSSSLGFPLDHEAVSKIFLAEFVSTIEHLTEVKELFTPDYREKKIPLVLANILSSAIQCLGQEETPPPAASPPLAGARSALNTPEHPTLAKPSEPSSLRPQAEDWLPASPPGLLNLSRNYYADKAPPPFPPQALLQPQDTSRTINHNNSRCGSTSRKAMDRSRSLF
jgi:hypothetical protein